MRITCCVLLLFCFSLQNLSAKIRILTFHYNRADFLEFQCKACQKFFIDDYEIIVINDAPNPINEKSIRDVCEKYNIKCVRYEQSWHIIDPLNEWIRMQVDTPDKNSYFQFPMDQGYVALDLLAISEQCSIRHCHVIQYALDLFGYRHDDIVVIMDADVFPIQPISIRSLLTDLPLVGIDSEFQDKHYLWVPFIAFDPKRLPNIQDLRFHVGIIDNKLCDTGSQSFNYLKDHPEVSYRLYPRCSGNAFFPWDRDTFLKFGFNNPEMTKISWPTPFEFYVDYHFVHYLGGSADIHLIKKQQALYDLLNSVLD